MTFHSGSIGIIGQPNVGKSTLLNRIVGEPLSIVTPKPQTTRHRISGIYNRENSQMVFLDTPGYHRSSISLNQYMCEVVEQTIHASDVCLFLMAPRTEDPRVDQQLMEKISLKVEPIIVINKADLLEEGDWDTLAEEARKRWDLKELFFISALKGDGVNHLLDEIESRLPEGDALFAQDIYTELPLRFLAAEAVREQAMMLLFQEIPYGVAVQVENFTEKPEITVICANIIVERVSHKQIVIGKGGQMIKKIGTRAREKIELLMGQKVFLELNVQVRENWTRDPNAVRELGYES